MIKKFIKEYLKTKSEIKRDNQSLDKEFSQNEANFKEQQKRIEQQRHNFEWSDKSCH